MISSYFKEKDARRPILSNPHKTRTSTVGWPRFLHQDDPNSPFDPCWFLCSFCETGVLHREEQNAVLVSCHHGGQPYPRAVFDRCVRRPGAPSTFVIPWRPLRIMAARCTRTLEFTFAKFTRRRRDGRPLATFDADVRAPPRRRRAKEGSGTVGKIEITIIDARTIVKCIDLRIVATPPDQYYLLPFRRFLLSLRRADPTSGPAHHIIMSHHDGAETPTTTVVRPCSHQCPIANV
jgi:hypothetical protein